MVHLAPRQVRGQRLALWLLLVLLALVVAGGPFDLAADFGDVAIEASSRLFCSALRPAQNFSLVAANFSRLSTAISCPGRRSSRVRRASRSAVPWRTSRGAATAAGPCV
jgi:hypothetical protein